MSNCSTAFYAASALVSFASAPETVGELFIDVEADPSSSSLLDSSLRSTDFSLSASERSYLSF